jgi:uncharacterized membrane protein
MDRRLKVLLVVSLVFNVFLVGAVAGAMVVRHRLAEIAPPPGQRAGGLMRGLWALEPADRDAFRQAMRGRATNAEPLLRAARKARREAADEFAKPTFNQAAALAALTRARTAETAARAQLEEGVVGFAAGLPAGKREALGQSLGRGGRMMGMRRRDGPVGDGPRGGPSPGDGPGPDRP